VNALKRWALTLGALVAFAGGADAQFNNGAGTASMGFRAPGGLASYAPVLLTIPSTQWTSISDYPNSLIADGWTGTLQLVNIGNYSNGASGPSQNGCTGSVNCPNTAFPNYSTWYGLTSNYSGNSYWWTTPLITFNVTSPAFTSTGALTTTTRTIDATSYLRQTYPSLSGSGSTPGQPYLGTVGGYSAADLAFSEYVYATDAPSLATISAGAYYDGTNTAIAGAVGIVNKSTKAWPAPVGAWVTEPGRTFDGSSQTVEFKVGHAYGANGAPVAGVQIQAVDASGNATAWKSASLVASAKQPSTSCTAANGSYVLTGCGSVLWAERGMRLNVRGSGGHVPGQPVVLDIDYANLAANGAISNASPNITMNVSNPGSVVPGLGVYDITAGVVLGTVASYTGTALVLQANASNNGSGSSDVLAFLSQPTSTVGFGTWTTNNSACNTGGKAPCIALGVIEHGTPTALGAITFTLASAAPGGGSALAAGTALGDGLYADLTGDAGTGTITEVGSAGDGFGSNVATIAPKHLCTSACGASGTSLTLTAPDNGGQWAVGMYLYDSTPASPCIKTDINNGASTYISALATGTGGAGTYTLNTAIIAACTGHTLYGVNKAASPASMIALTAETISTAATSTSAQTAEDFRFEHNYVGTGGSVTVTAGPPLPVYSATFSSTDYSAATPSALVAGAIAFRARAWPLAGNQYLDTQIPNTQAVRMKASGSGSSSAANMTITNYDNATGSCAGINFLSALSVDAFDETTGNDLGYVTACSSGVLTFAGSGALHSWSNADVIDVGTIIACDWDFWNTQAAGLTAATAGTHALAGCNASNALWFGTASVTNAKNVSVNLHNLFAMYDPSGTQSYAPRYIWLDPSGTATTNSCAIQSTGADPATSSGDKTHYYATINAALTDAKKYNNNTSPCGTTNRNTGHNDLNGLVFCYNSGISTGNTYSGFGADIRASITNWSGRITLTSAVGGDQGGVCPAPGTYGGAPQQVTLQGTATTANNKVGQNESFENMTLTMTGGIDSLVGSDVGPTQAFAISYIDLQNDIVLGAGTGHGVVFTIGAVYANDIIDTESPNKAGLVAQGGNDGATIVSASTVICGQYATGTVAANPSNYFGMTGWDCATSGTVEYNPTQTGYPWFMTQVIDYNKHMGMHASTGYSPHPQYAPHFGMYDTHNISEAIDEHTTNGQSREDSGDSFNMPLANAVQHQSSDIGGRVNKWYIEGVSINVPTAVATGGAFASASNYYTQSAFSRPNNPGVVSATDSGQANNVFGTQNPLTVALNGSIKWTLPCDFTELAWFYVDQLASVTAVPQHLGDVAASVVVNGTQSGGTFNVTSLTGALYPGATLDDGTSVILDGGSNPVYVTACPSGGCTTTGAGAGNAYTLSGTPASALTGKTLNAQATRLNMCQNPVIVAIDPLTSASTGAVGLPAPVASNSFPNRNYLKDEIHETGNNEIDQNSKSDWFITEMYNGARNGNWARRYGVGMNSDVYVSQSYGNDTGFYFRATGQAGEVAPNNTYFPTANQTVYANMSPQRYSFADDSGIGDSSNPSSGTYPYLNDGETYACPASGSSSYNRVPAAAFAEPWDIMGNPHPTSGTGNAGAYDQGC
jgi:hypothetical protein